MSEPYVSQPDLICAVAKFLDRKGFKTLVPRQFNAVIEGCNVIMRELEQPERKSFPGMGLNAWLMSDDTGMSSRYMAHKLAGGPTASTAYPHDPGDFGRCVRLLQAVPEITDISPMAETCRQWKVLVTHWDELKSLYDEEYPSGKAPKLSARMKELLGNLTS